MAAELVVTRTGREVSISGTDFEVSTPVALSVVGAQDSGTIEHDLATDIAGAFDGSGLRVVPERSGVWLITADDGTNRVTERLQVFAG